MNAKGSFASAYRRVLPAALIAAGVVAASAQPAADDATLLPGPTRGAVAVKALGMRLHDVARRHNVAADRLRHHLERDKDLWLDRAGRLFFADSHVPDAVEAAAAEGAEGIVPPVALDQTFLLHSRPSASRKIYLDFNGHTTSGTYWQDVRTGSSTFSTPPYDFDGSTNGFSTNELQRIQYIWQRVAEDFSVFEVDVTTEDPGVDGLRKTSSSDTNYGVRVCIGGASTDWYSTNSYGGVAYIGSFSWSTDTPCFVFTRNLGTGHEKYTAEAISHEVGHTLGLYHDGTSSAGYYSGQGSGVDGWAPIMGVGYYQNTVQFSRGEYTGANNTQDDFAVMNGFLGFIPDDHGDTFATATDVPEGEFGVEGLVTTAGDVDMFRLNAGSGAITVLVGVDSRSPNLNVLATLYAADGTRLATNNPSASLGASLVVSNLPAGTYFVSIAGTGSGDPLVTGYSDYGSVGQYFLHGSTPNAGAPIALAAADRTSGAAPLAVQFTGDGSLDPDGGPLAFLWNFGDGTTSAEANPVKVFSTVGTFTTRLTVTDDEGRTSTATLVITASAPAPEVPSDLKATTASTSRINLTWADASANETGFVIERSTNGTTFTRIGTAAANATNYADTTVSSGRTYTYRVFATNSAGFSPPSNLATANTTLPPSAPNKLTLKVVSKTQINLTWNDNASNETGFYIERALTNAGPWIRIATAGKVESYNNTGLTAATKYFYRVQAYNAGGVSAFTSVASATTKP